MSDAKPEQPEPPASPAPPEPTQPKALYGDYYREIYAKGMLAGEKPALAISWAGLEQAAREAMDDRAVAYIFGGAGSEDTMRENAEAFRRWRIVPRMLRDMSRRDLSVELLGTTLPAPVMLAPIGVQTIVHPDGELASARAAAALGIGLITSTASGTAMEEIAAAADAAAPDAGAEAADANTAATEGSAAPRWYQLYWPNDPELAASLVSRAEACGYEAIVVTVDNFVPGWKPRDLEQAYLPFLEGVGIAQYLSDPVFRAALPKPPEEDIGAAVGHFLGVFTNPTLTWDDLEWLRDRTSLPIVLKGILHPADAREAAERGIEGLIVSNHGGRQIDGAIASLDALPRVREEVGDEMTILLDSGIRTGADAFKALALGADAIAIGRPYLWGLALAGQEGVETVLKMLLAELDLTLALSGCAKPSEATPELLVHAGPAG